jgi:hypothetical protein
MDLYTREAFVFAEEAAGGLRFVFIPRQSHYFYG